MLNISSCIGIFQVPNLSRTLTFHFDGSLWNFWIHFVISRSQPLEKIEFSLCNLKLSEETLGDWDVSLFSLKLGDVLLLDLTKALIILPLMRLWFVASLSHISRLCAMSLLADFGFECYKVNNQCQLNQQNSMCAMPLKENHWICSREIESFKVHWSHTIKVWTFFKQNVQLHFQCVTCHSRLHLSFK